MLKRLSVWLWRLDFTAMEVFSGVAAVLWGGWMLWHSNDIFASSTVFTTLGSIAAAEVWGSLALVLGVLQLWGICRRSSVLNRVPPFILSCFWIALLILLVVSNPHSPSGVIYGLFGFCEGAAYLKNSIRAYRR